MENTKMRTIRRLVVVVSLLLLLSIKGEAATLSVDCSSASLQAAIDKAKPRDTLFVSGTCNENLNILEEVHRITLDGQGKSTINGADATKDSITVRGKGITVKGFTITGGRDGILVNQGGTAFMDGNTIQNTGRDGINVLQLSYAVIVNNTIQNNRRNGIIINGGSFATIGFVRVEDMAPSPNTIQNNGGQGVFVIRSSGARIVGNKISGNKANGVLVGRTSHADIANNTIDGNGSNGIDVSLNSGVNLGSDKGTAFFDPPNSTTANNGGVGIRCSINSSADGRLGTVNGKSSAKDFDPSCVDSLIP